MTGSAVAFDAEARVNVRGDLVGLVVDVQQLTSDDDERRRRASYLAKYTTKSTEQAGGLLHRISRSDLDHAQVRLHVHGYLRTSYELDDKVTAAIRADRTLLRWCSARRRRRPHWIPTASCCA